MRKSLEGSVLLIGFILACSGCSSPGGEPLSLSAAAYRTAQPGPEIQWQFPPGGGLQSLSGGGYYVEIVVENKSTRDRKDMPTPDVYFVGPEGRTLHIILLGKSGDDGVPARGRRLFRLDTSGYTDMLLPTSGTTPTKLLIWFDKRVFSAVLPKLVELKDKEPTVLAFSEGAELPNIAAVQPTDVYSVNSASGEAPALIREQDKQMALYFSYVGVQLVPAQKQQPYSTGDIWQDMAKVGITKGTELQTVSVRPWPKGK